MNTIKGWTREEILEKVDYDAENGLLISKFSGKPCKWTDKQGYPKVVLYKNSKPTQFHVHRIIWFLENGSVPEDDLVLDHIDHNKENNHISNLRCVSRADNCRNRKPAKRNKEILNGRFKKTAVPGVTLDVKKLIYYVTGGGELLGHSYDYDEAKYIRWNWEFDNGFHENHGITP